MFFVGDLKNTGCLRFGKKGIAGKFLRFSLVGISNTAVDWLAFFALISVLPFFASREVLAKAASFAAAVANSFVLNSLWTFRSEVARGKKEGIGFFSYSRAGKFFVTALIGLGINSLAFSFARDASSFLPDLSSRIFSLALATAASLVWNFAVNLVWTYRVGEKKADE